MIAIPRLGRLTVLSVAMLVACAGPEVARTEAPDGGRASSAGATYTATSHPARSGHGRSTSREDGYTVPDRLRRPLRRVQMPPGCCRVTGPIHRGLAGIWGPAQGHGPVYPISQRGIFRDVLPPDPASLFAGTGYGVAKVIWVAEPAYDGPVLIRGFQIGGHHRVRFTGLSSTDEPLGFATEAVAPPDAWKYRWARGWRELKTLRFIAVRAPGCYAWQVDGTDFSYTIVFKVVDSSA